MCHYRNSSAIFHDSVVIKIIYKNQPHAGVDVVGIDVALVTNGPMENVIYISNI